MKKDNRCLDYRKVIKETETYLWYLERRQGKAIVRDRVRFVRLLKSGACTSQAQAGAAIGLGLRASEKLWHKYRTEGIEGLLTYPYQGTRGRLSEEQLHHLEEELQKDQTQSLAQAVGYVEQHFGIHYSAAGMAYVFRRLGVKKKTGRPVHLGKDTKGEQHFKKNAFPS